MSASAIETFRIQQFASNVNLLLQQKGSKLRPFFTEGSHQGKQASPVEQIDSVEASEVTSRFAPMTRTDYSTQRRWVFPRTFDLSLQVDSFDMLKMMVDIKSPLVQNAVLAMGRKIDLVAISAFLGTAKTGESGTSSTSFTSGNEIDVAVGGSNSRLNVAKLRAVRELAMAAHIDLQEDPLYCGITAKDDSALLNEIEIISRDFNGDDKPVLKDGRLERFLGINFVHCELLESLSTGTNEVNLPVWTKSAMYLGMWEDVKTSVSVRNDIQSEPWQVYVKGTFGATRLDEEKVFNIESYRA